MTKILNENRRNVSVYSYIHSEPLKQQNHTSFLRNIQHSDEAELLLPSCHFWTHPKALYSSYTTESYQQVHFSFIKEHPVILLFIYYYRLVPVVTLNIIAAIESLPSPASPYCLLKLIRQKLTLVMLLRNCQDQLYL